MPKSQLRRSFKKTFILTGFLLFLLDTRVDPSLLEKVGKLERQRIADQLNERLLQRPGPIELIQDRILPVESPIQNAIDQGNVDYQQTVSPASSHADSPSVSELETGINTLNCTSPSPPPPLTTQQITNDVNLSEISFKNTLKNVSESANIPGVPLYVSGDSFKSNSSSQISISQRENERLVKSVNKKSRQQKPKVKKLKFHECLPGVTSGKKVEESPEVVDERYQRLLEQQTLYLRLQVMQQNAVMNALQGNTETMEQVNEEIESMITKEQKKSSETIKSIDGKKLDDLRVIDLRAQLKQRGLLVSGSKAKLIERLSSFEAGKSTPADFAYSNTIMHDSAHPNNKNTQQATVVQPNTDISSPPATTVMQVTAYATNSGQAYQLIQAVPQQSQNVMQYQVLPAHASTGGDALPPQLRLDQVNTLPVVTVAQPSVMTMQERVSDKPLRAQATPSPSHIQFHISPPPQQSSPTIVLHSGLPLQQASLHHRPKSKVKVQKLPVISQGQCFTMPENVHQDAGIPGLSQSVPPPLQFNNNYIIDTNSTNLNYQNSLSNSSLNQEMTTDIFNGNNQQQQQFRGRASSEPASQLKRFQQNNKVDTTKSVFSNQLEGNNPSSPLSFQPLSYQMSRMSSSSSSISLNSYCGGDAQKTKSPAMVSSFRHL